MALDFPASPALNQVYSSGGASYFWNGYAWEGGGAISPASVTSVSDTPPANPLPGQLWWESDTGMLFTSYNDSNTTQWVQINALQANAVLKTGDTMTGVLIAPGVNLAAGGALLNNGGANAYTMINDGSNANAFLAGGNSDPANYYRNTTHKFQSRTSVDLFQITATQINVPITTTSTSPTTGALTVAGGVGVAGQLRAAFVLDNRPYQFGLYGGNCYQLDKAYGLYVENNSNPVSHFNRSANTDGSFCYFSKGGTFVGHISVTGVTTSYNTTSSAELKEDLQSFDAGRIIDNTEVYDFKWKGLDERAYGIIAQQAVEVYPLAVSHIENDEVGDWWGVDYSKYVPVLLQELKAVRARLAELEAVVSPKKGR